MSSDPDSTKDEGLSGEFGIVLDDDLLAAALSAVEKVGAQRSGAKGRGRPNALKAVPDSIFAGGPPDDMVFEDDDEPLPHVGDTTGDELEIDLGSDFDQDFDLDSAAAEALIDAESAGRDARGPTDDGLSLLEAHLADGVYATEDEDAARSFAEMPASASDEDTVGTLLNEVAAAHGELDVIREELDHARKRLDVNEKERRRLLGARSRLDEQLNRTVAAAEQNLDARRAAEEQSANLRRRVNHLEGELKSLRERRRREIDELQLRGHTRTIEQILPILDNLELALVHKSGDAERVVDGVEMILQQAHQTLQQMGVERVVAGPGVLFDPEVHEAISEVVTEEMLPGSIVEHIRPGYSVRGRLLRAARVAVATQPPRPPASPDAADSAKPEAEPDADPLVAEQAADAQDADATPVLPDLAPPDQSADGPAPSAEPADGDPDEATPPFPPTEPADSGTED